MTLIPKNHPPPTHTHTLLIRDWKTKNWNVLYNVIFKISAADRFLIGFEFDEKMIFHRFDLYFFLQPRIKRVGGRTRVLISTRQRFILGNKLHLCDFYSIPILCFVLPTVTDGLIVVVVIVIHSRTSAHTHSTAKTYIQFNNIVRKYISGLYRECMIYIYSN